LLLAAELSEGGARDFASSEAFFLLCSRRLSIDGVADVLAEFDVISEARNSRQGLTGPNNRSRRRMGMIEELYTDTDDDGGKGGVRQPTYNV
jgi:hypothetical protein